jgi:toxin CcdB
MAQFDVYRNPSDRSRRVMPYLVAVQHDGVSETASVLMVPAVAPLKGAGSSRLYPKVTIGQKQYTLLTPDMASLPRAVLGDPIENVAEARDRIIAALDILFVGS